jgi:RNA polymerase sigma factor (sigma-70 family)
MVRQLCAAEVEASPLARLSAHDELRLLRLIAEGDRLAFERLYRLYHPRLSRFVANMARRPELIEEVVNDTLVAVWRRPESYNGMSKVSTWILAIAYRKALKARRRWDEPVEDTGSELREGSESAPDQRLGREQTRAALLKAMASLSADHRAVVDLSYFHEIGYREIAEIMACPVDTVKTRMFHARRCLRSALPGRLEDWL